MEEIDDLPAPSLPLGITIPSSILFLLLMLYAAYRLRYMPATLVLMACWLRYVVSIFHEFSFNPSPLGPTWNALISIGVVAVGLFTLRPRLLNLKLLLPLYILVLVALASAVVNNSFSNLTITLTKLGYLIVVTLCAYQSLIRFGERFFQWLLIAFLPPFVFQLVSVLIGQTKAGELDGSVSYVGGYNHEGAISIVLCTALMIVSLARSMQPALRWGTITWAIFGIILADYRTAILAFLPLLVVVFVTGPFMRLLPTQRAMVALASIALVGGVTALSFDKLGERYADLAAIGAVPAYLQRAPDDFNRQDQALFSGRVYLWARYLSAWRQGPPHYQIIGAGPEARIPTKDRYPHNTLVSAVFEYGYIGLITYLVILFTPMIASFGASGLDRVTLVAAHGCFFILNMATMPLWQMEGNILYGLLLAYTLFALQRAPRGARARHSRSNTASAMAARHGKQAA